MGQTVFVITVVEVLIEMEPFAKEKALRRGIDSASTIKLKGLNDVEMLFAFFDG